MRFLVLGSKEYPVGSAKGHDPLPSGGMEKYVHELAGALRADGHDVTLITRKFDQPPIETIRGVHVHRVAWWRGFFLRNPSYNFNAYLHGRHLDYDVAIANGVFATLTALALRHSNHKPVIARPAGVAWVQPQYPSWTKTILRQLERLAYRHANAVVFPNPQEHAAFRKKMGFDPVRSILIPTGINLAPFKAPHPHKKSRRPKLVFVGRLQKVKGVEYLLDAMASVDAELLIVGTGPQEHELKKIVREKNLGKVRFLGNRTDVPRVLASADAFVLPSLSEGLPLALLEAWAARLPVIVTDIGLPVKANHDALVVPPADAPALARAIRRLIREPKLAKRLSQNGRRRVERDHDWKKAAKKYAEEARRLCAAS